MDSTSDGPRIGSLCSGYGGLDSAVQEVFGGTLAWVADPDPGAAAILAAHHPDTPNLGDITTVDFAQAEPVDILAMGFPCQDVSVAGQRAGLQHGNRSGLWHHCARAIQHLNPSLVVIENVPGLLSSRADSGVEPCPWCLGERGGEPEPDLRALGAVLADLHALGFDAEWSTLRASDIGACHQRNRVFVLAWPSHAPSEGLEDGREGRPARDAAAVPDAAGDGRHPRRTEPARLQGRPGPAGGGGGTPADPTGVRHGHAGTPVLGRLSASAVAGGPAVDADAAGVGFQRGGQHGDGGLDLRTFITGVAAADADGEPRDQRRHPAPGETQGGGASAVGCGCDRAPWGRYASAVHRWEQVTGRAAPLPVDGRGRLSPVFVEFLMGLAEGHVTAVPGLSRNAQLKALGNGVIPAQAAAALRLLLARMPAVLSAAL